MVVYKVGSKSEPGKLAGAIAGAINEEGQVKLECIGAGAVNNAIKGIATARGFVISSGSDLVVQPHFKTIMLDGEEKTAIIMIVKAVGEVE